MSAAGRNARQTACRRRSDADNRQKNFSYEQTEI